MNSTRNNRESTPVPDASTTEDAESWMDRLRVVMLPVSALAVATALVLTTLT
ncbi:hypothetical protein [Streptomyces minutiscleroticus]|uniref:Uncharacterized protein n=1 Tax=Streptomyces minutiscleroticus TaxID=68238 RepID=A0A918KLK2_9ACTN|nr:hypothetical protein [Streptomyces minutiscleroticus]GGX66259.1 hypothetical protein GCM10010358_20830 [Streptomyces minutiscleroticus]